MNNNTNPIMNENLAQIGIAAVKALKDSNQQVTIIDEYTNGLASGAITGISGSSGVFEFAYVNLGTDVKTALKESQAHYCMKISKDGEISIIPKDKQKQANKEILEWPFSRDDKDVHEKIVCTALACLAYKVTNPEISLEETKHTYEQIAAEQDQVQYTSHSFENQKAEEVKALLEQEGLTLSTVESITCGLAGRALGAKQTYGTYSNHAKNIHVGVDQITMDKHHEVSVNTATQMAVGGLQKSGTDICMSFTGFAGKAWVDGSRFDKKVGFEIPKEKNARQDSNKPDPKRIGDAQVCMCIAYNDKGTIKTHIIKDVFADYTDKDNPKFNRDNIRDNVITSAAKELKTVVDEIVKQQAIDKTASELCKTLTVTPRSKSVDHQNAKQLDSKLNRIDPLNRNRMIDNNKNTKSHKTTKSYHSV